jgi:hypothetical protein
MIKHSFSCFKYYIKYILRGGPLEIPGGGGGAKKNAWKKNSCSHYVKEKKVVQANSKV